MPLWLYLAVFCFLYYIIILIYRGIHTTFSVFWLFAGLCGIFIFFITKQDKAGVLVIPVLLKYVLSAFFCLGVFLLLVIETLIITAALKKTMPNADYMLILGAQVKGSIITSSLKKRLDAAVQYAEKMPESKLIVSGGRGKGETITEARAMQDYLIKQGISKNRILLEENSVNTYQNIIFSKNIILESPKGREASVIIVTNAFHIYRGVEIAKKQGLTNVSGLAAPADSILGLNYYTREAFAVFKDKWKKNM